MLRVIHSDRCQSSWYFPTGAGSGRGGLQCRGVNLNLDRHSAPEAASAAMAAAMASASGLVVSCVFRQTARGLMSRSIVPWCDPIPVQPLLEHVAAM